MIRSHAARLARRYVRTNILEAPWPSRPPASTEEIWIRSDSCVCGRWDPVRMFRGTRTVRARVYCDALGSRKDVSAPENKEPVCCRSIEWGNYHYFHHPISASSNLHGRQMSTAANVEESVEENSDNSLDPILPKCIKVKRLNKTSRHIMNILDKEAVDKVKAEKDIPDIRAGCIVELKVEAPENKGRISTVRGLVIARKNAGICTSIQVRRLEGNVGVDTIFPLYSPNIKEMKVLERRSVRRAKLYYVRDRPFNIALKELAQRTAKKREKVLRGKRTDQSKK